MACSIKRRIADTETFDADVMPDKKIDKKFAVVLTMLKYPFLYKNVTIHKNIRTQHCLIISKNHIFFYPRSQFYLMPIPARCLYQGKHVPVNS